MFGRLGDEILIAAILAVCSAFRLAGAMMDSWPPHGRR